jgi:hypothetical protein
VKHVDIEPGTQAVISQRGGRWFVHVHRHTDECGDVGTQVWEGDSQEAAQIWYDSESGLDAPVQVRDFDQALLDRVPAYYRQHGPPILSIDWETMIDVIGDTLFDRGRYQGTEEEQIEQATRDAEAAVANIRARMVVDLMRDLQV